jgi:hypothetical protein
MNTLLQNTRNPKFLIALEKPLADNFGSKYHLKNLNEKYSAVLLQTLAGEHLPKVHRDDKNLLAKHEIISI